MASGWLEELAARRRFGMRPGLATIAGICRRLGHPERKFRVIHVAGTNGKGAVSAILDACLGGGRYTSPHLVRLNERYFLHGRPLDDATLERAAAAVSAVAPEETTFFEALTAVAFLVYAEARTAHPVFECGLGGRFDATNVCESELSVITRIGLDHCDWLGDTVEKIAAEKAGIIRPGVPVVLARNADAVRRVIEARAREVGAPFVYAPDLATDDDIPADFSLRGGFNRENAVTALAALKTLKGELDFRAVPPDATLRGFARVTWPGRFQEVGPFIVDGAHNPPAATALAAALGTEEFDLIAGFCADKDVDETLRILAPRIVRALAVQTRNPRSLRAEETAARMKAAGIAAEAAASLGAALARQENGPRRTLVCGSLFLAGEALVELGAFPWGADGRYDVNESLRGA